MQYRVIYTFSEWNRKQTKTVSSVSLIKKKEDFAPDSVQAMNGIDVVFIEFKRFTDLLKKNKFEL